LKKVFLGVFYIHRSGRNMIPRWRRQNGKVTFWSNAFGIGNFSPYSNNGTGIGTNWYPSPSPNCVSGTSSSDTAA